RGLHQDAAVILERRQDEEVRLRVPGMAKSEREVIGIDFQTGRGPLAEADHEVVATADLGLAANLDGLVRPPRLVAMRPDAAAAGRGFASPASAALGSGTPRAGRRPDGPPARPPPGSPGAWASSGRA